MRELIALTAIGLGSVLVLAVVRAMAPRRPGRHTAEYLDHQAEPVSASPWSRPWTSPSKEEAAAIFRQQAETTMQLRAVRERRRALDAAARGRDYPYTYPGAPFRSEHFAAAGVTA
ncbi:hypothetical protein [Streptomyces sp. NPDC085529]|uniref:hypothetical protein n=1 Tax=Streptomyces sp. NPDC085529 TaxID=3365729 RepID=UPI0037D513C4